jgi:hypothetical protein
VIFIVFNGTPDELIEVAIYRLHVITSSFTRYHLFLLHSENGEDVVSDFMDNSGGLYSAANYVKMAARGMLKSYHETFT